MDADKALAIFVNEAQKVGLLADRHFEVAAGVEQHRIEIVQVFRVVFQFLFCEGLGVHPDYGIPEAALAPQALDGGHGVWHGFMAVALLFADHQEFLAGADVARPATQRRRSLRADAMRYGHSSRSCT